MEEVKLDVQVRAEMGKTKVKAVRQGDFVPGIVYGGDSEPTAIKLDRRTYDRIRRQHHGESIVFHLNILEGANKLKDYSAIVKEEQHDPVTDKILHVDFKRISLQEEIEVEVPLTAKGEPIGVKKGGGSLEHVLWELEVICLPMDIPQHIDVDVSALEIGDVIQVKDLALPAGVKTKQDPESIVFSVAPPMKEEEAPAEGADAKEPELIKPKKATAEEAPAGEAKKTEGKKKEG